MFGDDVSFVKSEGVKPQELKYTEKGTKHK